MASQTLSRDEALQRLIDIFGEGVVKGLQDEQWKVGERYLSEQWKVNGEVSE